MALEESVRRVDSLESLFGLLSGDELAWPLDPSAMQDDGTFAWSTEELRLDESAARHISHGSVQQLRPFPGVRSQPWGIFLVTFTDGRVYRTALRQVLRGLVPSRRRESHLRAWHHENLLFICTTREHDRFTFAHFRGKQRQKARLATFGWQQGDPYVRTLCEFNLPALRFPEDEGRDTQGWLSAWAKAFDKEPLTRRFFKQFDEALGAIRADLQKFQDFDSADAYSRAQLLLERLIFLYFLQNRGWLAQDRNFIISRFVPFRDRPDEFSYYEDFLEKLFWSLASPPRSDSFRFADVPFLNGGLFDDDEFSPARKKHNPPLKIRNATFARVFSDLLEAFNFTVCEDTPLNQDVAVDPEMLGKVFESIVLHAEAADPDAVAPDKRKATGSYYTPRIVVHFICREALLQWLKTQLADESWTPRLKALFEIDPTDGLDTEELERLRNVVSPGEGARLRDLLQDVTCCDPAVGSGAFPVGLLHELVNLRRVVEAAANGYVDPVRKKGTEWLHETKANIVENCLYGVDIQQQAIEICRLRLWLSLVVDYDLGLDAFEADKQQFRAAIGRISQLPNLEMNFHRGDSLHDHISGVPVIVEGLGMRQYQKQMDAIRKLGVKLHHATSGERKRKLRVEILRRRLDLTEAVLNEEFRKLQNRDAGVAAVLFEEAASDAEKRRRLAEEIEHVQRAIEKIQIDRMELERLAGRIYDTDFRRDLRRLEGADFDSPFNFAWRLDLPAIFARQPPGFDIVVGNPPFVTARNPEKRELYRTRWQRVCYGTYLLLCPFFDLGFGLLRDGGELGFIVSNAFMKRELGKPLVEDFFSIVNLQKIIDCSGLMFPGHGTPTCVVFGSNAPPHPSLPVRATAILPGGGDLRTPPENSALWHALAAQHDNPGHEDLQIGVYDWPRKRLLQWPMTLDLKSHNLRERLDDVSELILADVMRGNIGRICFTGADDLFFVDDGFIRRGGVNSEVIARFAVGDSFRNWVHDEVRCLCPYDLHGQLLSGSESSPLKKRLSPWQNYLEERLSYGQTQVERGLKWWEYAISFPDRIKEGLAVCFCEIATHMHAEVVSKPFIANRSNPIFHLRNPDQPAGFHLCASHLNSSAALFWLKQVCFSKRESEKGATDTYFEFAGGKVEQLPLPEAVAEAMRGQGSPLAALLTSLAEACWQRGAELPRLAMRTVLEKPSEAYQDWNASLPGYGAPHEVVGGSFKTADDLRAAIKRIIEMREKLRAEMVARQEEMDWLVYQAYGLIEDAGPALPDEDMVLAREERPFCLWQAAEGHYAKAVALIPQGWSEAKRALWKRRLELIRDNEHVRRIEQPVYKRRWDEQWKVGNRWQCGQPAYDAEFIDAFRWWLSEKAEWWLEHRAQGAMTLGHWTAALGSDSRVQAAWQVAAEAIQRLEAWKQEQKGDTAAEPLELDASRATFARFFRKLVKDQAVPEGIPFAVPWDELAKKKVKVPAYVKRIRGKLNVPRERFWITEDGLYRQAQPLGPASDAPSSGKSTEKASAAGKGGKGNFKLRPNTRTVTGRLSLPARKEEPKQRSRGKAPSLTDFDRDQLKAALLEVVGADWIERDDAIRAAAQSLGFKRCGKRIHKAFASAITGLLRQNLLEHDRNTIRRK